MKKSLPVSKSKKTNSRIKGIFYFSFYLLCMPMIACADVSDTLNDFFAYLTGDIGKAIAMLAIVSVGFGCFVMGKVSKSYVIAVVIGIGIIFSARAILTAISV